MLSPLSFRPLRVVLLVASAAFALCLSAPSVRPETERLIILSPDPGPIEREPSPFFLSRWLAPLALELPAAAAPVEITPAAALAPPARRLGRLAVRRGVGHRLTRPS